MQTSRSKASPPHWALELAREAANAVPAYADFLKKHSASTKSFELLPITTKKNYLAQHPLHKLIAKGSVPEHLHASSGSSGRPTHWLRSAKQDEWGGALHARMFREVLRIYPEQNTLAIVCFSMGIWVAGGFTQSSLTAMQRLGWRLTISTPAMSDEDILSLLNKFLPMRDSDGASLYSRIVLFGYPPFIAKVLDEAKQRGLLPDDAHRIRIVTGGSAITEEWRERMLDTVGALNRTDVVNVYGSADAALMGFETPETMWLRQLADEMPDIRNVLVPPDASRFSLFTYDPERIYFEAYEGELLITVRDAAIPLIRYNIHDKGRVLTNIPKLGKRADLPLVVVTGRTDVALTFYSINMYPEHFQDALESPKVSKLVTGSFRAYTKESGKKHLESLHIDIECAEGVKPKEVHEKQLADALVLALTTLSIEYRKLREMLGIGALPHVSLVPHGGLELRKRGTQTFVYTKGKKPRMATE